MKWFREGVALPRSAILIDIGGRRSGVEGAGVDDNELLTGVSVFEDVRELK